MRIRRGGISKAAEITSERLASAIENDLLLLDDQLLDRDTLHRLVASAKGILQKDLPCLSAIKNWGMFDDLQIPRYSKDLTFSPSLLTLCEIRTLTFYPSNYIWSMEECSRAADVLTWRVCSSFDASYPVSVSAGTRDVIAGVIYAAIFTCFTVWGKLTSVSSQELNDILDNLYSLENFQETENFSLETDGGITWTTPSG